MLVRGLKRLFLPVASFLLLTFVVATYFGSSRGAGWSLRGGLGSLPFDRDSSSGRDVSQTHHEVFSVSRADKKFFTIKFGELEATNPSIIPHPSLNDTWIITAQHMSRGAVKDTVWFAELVCNAAFNKNGQLECLSPPMNMPIAATIGDRTKCTGELAFFALNIGPHDARVFYGPRFPLTIYGSNSMFTCFGQWVLDFRMLMDWGYEHFFQNEFRTPTEIQRPSAYGAIEKNWFMFWDLNGQMYAHYDVAPKRVFAKLEYNGSVGQDLAPLAAAQDSKCMQKYMPSVGPKLESIHQATNSLAVTLCNRSDPKCKPDENNTFVLTIFQHKSFHAFHSVYEPYAMLFRQSAPFEVYGISSKPIWIHGRGKEGQGKKPPGLTPEEVQTWNQTEMFYITSISWKTHGQKYHGYSDDVLFISFGIEDETTAGIDVLASDLLQGLGLCSIA
ncbi:uncharacterized protein GIQ15_00514 [Arthroderma uncinatum]|uniref:uncharacterized protein n=1 Tax=Arthroderma uncinatum TaxID=74035 RepID=UPI00144AB036|nr:uncharacterized protein GIQ15_00514 [Arthroderma uncinatum]KAF3490997.1 hypothetical protein GIQ15_00514 [Arthroderma uncinatum]